MRNLEMYGVQDMSINDQKRIDGGFWLAFITVCLITGVVAGLWNKSDSCNLN